MKTKIKKLALGCLFILIQNKSFCQFKPFELSGVIHGIKNGNVRLFFEPTTDTGIVLLKNDQATLHDEKFRISGNIRYPHLMRIVIDDSIVSRAFFVDYGKIQGEFTLNSSGTLSSQVFSVSNLEYRNDYLKKTKFTDDQLDELDAQYELLSSKYENIPPEIEDSLQNVRKKIRADGDSVLYQYIVEHPNSYVALWNLIDNVRRGYSPLKSKSLYSLSSHLQNSITGLEIKKILRGQQLTSVNSIFPKIPLINSEGRKYTITSKMFGKYTLVDFWFSHCGPCISTFPELKKLYSDYEKQGFEILGISVDTKENRIPWLKKIKENKLPWPQYWDVDYREADKLGISMFPSTFLLDKEGRVIARNLEAGQLRKFLEDNL